MTISTNPIQTPIQEKERQDRADWTNFQEHLQATRAPNITTATKQEIDDELEAWYADIEEARRLYIPKTRHKTIPHPRKTRELAQLEDIYQQVKTQANRAGWTRPLRHRYRALQIRIKNTWTVEKEKVWEELIKKNTRPL